ncbi:MAG: glycosyltransferase family 39 protein, partial [Actinomycetota bacterium]|nr:glycosyltransferase family 39 protein [Actinomycetota bacterium]
MTAARLRPPPALAILLLAGVGARLWLMLDYRPAYLSSNDSARFLHFAHIDDGMFEDTFGPTGYAAFLKLLRLVSDQLEFTVAVQHLLGVASALLLYAAVRRLGAPVWAACVPAGVVLLSGDQLYMEHTLLSEGPFLPLVAGGLYAAVRALDAERPLRWLALAGALLASTALFRNVGMILPPALVVWAALFFSGRRLVSAGVAAAAAAAVLGIYAGIAALDGGNTGWTATSGWNAYGRSAPFADCDEFDPPPGTESLCEDTPPERRPGSLFYLWFEGSPARAKYGHPPIGQDTLGKWGRRAILAQPLDYVGIVIDDLPRFLDPELNKRRFSGGGYFLMSRRGEEAEGNVLFQLSRDYDHARYSPGSSGDTVADWQRKQRVHGVVPGLFVAFALIGFAVARGPALRGVALFAFAGGGLVVMP